MFLDWIAQLRLLQHDSQSNILDSLPLPIRRNLVSEITSFLHPLNGKHLVDPAIFSSPAHVKWYMEVIGQGFALPLEDMAITNDDITIYSQWLLDPNTRPAAVVCQDLEQEFYQIIFHQYSLLFQPRIFRSSNVSSIPRYQPTSNQVATNGDDDHHMTPAMNQHCTTQQQDDAHSTTTTTTTTLSDLHLTTVPVHAHYNMMPFTLPPHQQRPSQPITSSSFNNNSSSNTPPSQPHTPQQQNSATNTVKDTLAPLVQRHIDLCKKTLLVICSAGRNLDLSPDTWIDLLKVILGITDSLLKEPSGETPIPGVKNISDELCEPLLRVLFELWLRSRVKEIEMWNMLKHCFTRWSHRPQVIQYWTLTSLSLTNRIIHMLYGQKEGTDTVHLFADNNGIKLDLPRDDVKYCWHRILYLLPIPVQLSPPNFIIAMTGIGQIVDRLNSVGLSPINKASDTSPPSAVDATWSETEPPDGNTILNMFGSILFDACALATDIENIERQSGCAEAIGTLCKVFCRPQRRNGFLRTYLERFYAALSLCLKSDTCLPTVLFHSTELFATDLQGLRMLVPDFIAAAKMVVPKLKIDVNAQMLPVDTLRLAALKIIGTVMCLPNHYENVTLKAGWEWDMQCSSDASSTLPEQDQMLSRLIRVLYEENTDTQVERPYTNLKFYILELLLMAFRTETSSYNLRYVLHLINVYVVEDVPFCPGLVGTVVKLIQDKILTMQLPSDVTLVAFDVLMDFVELYDYVKRDSKNIARELVLALSRYVDALINARKLAHSYPLIVQAYNCMIKWILVSQWIMDDRDCYQAVIATLSKGITLLERTADTTLPSTEKKKRRDTTFTPTKQLFQLQPRSNRAASSANNHTNNNEARTTSTNRHGYRKEEMAVRMAAEYCMSQFVNQLGRSPFRDKSTLSHAHHWLASMDDLGQQRGKTSATTGESSETDGCDNVRYFLLENKMILAIVDTTGLKDGSRRASSTDTATSERPRNIPSLVAIIRDTTGNYIWSMEACYQDTRFPIKQQSSSSTSSAQPESTESAAAAPPHLTPLTISNHLTTSPSVIITPDEHADYFHHHQMDQQQHENSPNPPSSITPTAVAVNNDDIPHLDSIFEKNTDNWKQWRSVKKLAEHQQEAEQLSLKKNPDKPLHYYKCLPTASNVDLEYSKAFRLILSQLGYMLPQNRYRITPLRLSESLITEIEALDALNPRECISVSVYYAQSGDSTWSDITTAPTTLDESFMQFLNCIGWPVDLKHHTGFKGKLDSSICQTMPYYADRTVEFVANVPYLITADTMLDHITSEDHICVIWIKHLVNYTSLAQRIKSANKKSKFMVYLFIHPLPNTANGLYWIRILVSPFGNTPAAMVASQRLNENALIFGPLVDKMVVSRHALGAMVRNTVISAHQACRVVTDTYTRPYVVRKKYIEELSLRHRTKMSLSDFYTEIFSGKYD
ncbi:hypothetical protein BC941DRAFT_470077 [Chlamydoabsidia padenii]|nr:hypothetical protein BC941DRAFT_470077 [Chlamydoabsidia padenii]